MSWTTILPYFRTHLDAEGLREWDEPFDSTNIPATLLDNAYNFEFGDFSGEGLNQNDQETLVALTCRIFKKGYANPKTARDEAIQLGQDLVEVLLAPTNRLNATFKNVRFDNMNIHALSDQNDNALVIDLEFSIRSVLAVC